MTFQVHTAIYHEDGPEQVEHGGKLRYERCGPDKNVGWMVFSNGSGNYKSYKSHTRRPRISPTRTELQFIKNLFPGVDKRTLV